ncbi:MAG: fimbrillin family protein [Bacteroidaceae bacterium]|nr:fimbrillin family protein [Bacteroidaceae bacterium]
MIRFHIRWVLLALLALTIVGQSCSDQDDVYITKAVMRPVTFTASGLVDVSVHSISPTRASDTEFESNDKLAIWAVRADTVLDNGQRVDLPYTFSDSSYFWTSDACYQADALGGLTCISDNPVMQFEDTLLAMPLVYYVSYPYASGRKAAFNFIVKTDQRSHDSYTASDLAMQRVGPTRLANVDLQLRHKMSNVVVRLTGFDISSSDITVDFLNVYVSVQANQNTQTVVTGNGLLTNIRSDVKFGEFGTASSTQRQFHAIVAPQTVSHDTDLLRVVVDGDTLIGKTSNDGHLYSGKQSVIAIDLDNSLSQDSVYLHFGGEDEGGQEADAPRQVFDLPW